MDRPTTTPHSPTAADQPVPFRPAVTVRCVECGKVVARPFARSWVLAVGCAEQVVPGVCPTCQEARFAVAAG
jgi:hypothetical protein